jgi:hypothetical protein
MRQLVTEPWMLALKAGVGTGYYLTEVAEGEQTHFPWQNRHCGECPFWLNHVRRLHAEKRSAESHTYRFFNPAHHHEGQELIEGRIREARRLWLQPWSNAD